MNMIQIGYENIHIALLPDLFLPVSSRPLELLKIFKCITIAHDKEFCDSLEIPFRDSLEIP